jgi:hypothetical protein
MVLPLPARNDFQIAKQGLGLDAAVGLDVTDGHIHPLVLALVGGLKHGISLANPGGVTQEDLELTALGLRRLNVLEQCIRIGTPSFF